MSTTHVNANKEAKGKNTKKITFSPEIDDAINGFSIGLTFLTASLFLYLKNDYLTGDIYTVILSTLIGLFGFCMCSIQLGKSPKVERLVDFAIGFFFFILWLLVYKKLNLLFTNFIALVLFILGVYGMIRGTIEIGYSICTRIVIRSPEKRRTTQAKELFLLFSQFCGLVLTVLNILKIIGFLKIDG